MEVVKDSYTGKGGLVYIANVTQQNQIINFRLPDSRKPHSIGIPMGRQQLIGELSTPEIDAMVEQLGPYGLAQLGHESKKEKLTYVFNVGTPVPSSVMQRLYDQNRGILSREGVERRKEQAVAMNNVMNTDETPLKNVEISVEEVDPGSLGADSENISEGIRVVDESTSENKPKRRRTVAK